MPSSWSLVVFSALIAIPSIINAIKIKHPLEIVILLDESSSMTRDGFERMWNVTRQFPDFFLVNGNLTRVAIIRIGTQTTVALSLTSDENRLRTFNPGPSQIGGGTFIHDGLRLALEQVFQGVARSGVRKIILIITDGTSYDVIQAAPLRDEVDIIYIAYIGDLIDPQTNTSVTPHLVNVTDDQSRIFSVSDFDQFTEDVFGWLQQEIERELCKYNETRRFDESNLCVADWWRAEASEEFTRQDSKPLQSTITCQEDDCRQTCDRHWPWKCPADDCGKILIRRDGPIPNGRLKALTLQNCDREKTEDCPCVTSSPHEIASTASGPGSSESGSSESGSSGQGSSAQIGRGTFATTEYFFPRWAVPVVSLVCLIALLVLIALAVTGVVALCQRCRAKKSGSGAESVSVVLEFQPGKGQNHKKKVPSEKSFADFHGRGLVGKERSLQVSLRDEKLKKANQKTVCKRKR